MAFGDFCPTLTVTNSDFMMLKPVISSCFLKYTAKEKEKEKKKNCGTLKLSRWLLTAETAPSSITWNCLSVNSPLQNRTSVYLIFWKHKNMQTLSMPQVISLKSSELEVLSLMVNKVLEREPIICWASVTVTSVTSSLLLVQNIFLPVLVPHWRNLWTVVKDL